VIYGFWRFWGVTRNFWTTEFFDPLKTTYFVKKIQELSKIDGKIVIFDPLKSTKLVLTFTDL
jgi:hypothetical protein